MSMPLFARTQKGEEERVWRVSSLNRDVRLSLERGYGELWVEGEVSEVTHAASGHVYFTLSDPEEPAQLRVVMFRGDARRAKEVLAKGTLVRIRGGLSLFEPRGTFQMIARAAVPAGVGDIHAQLEQLRRKLEAEGLFADEKKRALPRFPQVVGVVTSRTGAALQDVIKVARERYPVRIVVADCRVQGDGAPSSIVAALTAVQQLASLDVVIVGRGGGSAEELWSFNDERVVRAIAACRVPIVSAVGHEVDVTLADLAADVRAATPSNAAELVVPDRRMLAAELEAWERRLARALETDLGRKRLLLERLHKRVVDPRHAVGRAGSLLEGWVHRLERSVQRRLRDSRAQLTTLEHALGRRSPRALLARDRQAWDRITGRLHATARPLIDRRRTALLAHDARLRAIATPLIAKPQAQLGEASGRLHALSPLAVLARGYAIAIHTRTGKALVRAGDSAIGDELHVQLHEGAVIVRVETKQP